MDVLTEPMTPKEARTYENKIKTRFLWQMLLVFHSDPLRSLCCFGVAICPSLHCKASPEILPWASVAALFLSANFTQNAWGVHSSSSPHLSQPPGALSQVTGVGV